MKARREKLGAATTLATMERDEARDALRSVVDQLARAREAVEDSRRALAGVADMVSTSREAGRVIDPQLMAMQAHYHAGLSEQLEHRLDRERDEQRAEVEQRADLMIRHGRLRALERLQVRRGQELLQAEARREQRNMDDLGTGRGGNLIWQ